MTDKAASVALTGGAGYSFEDQVAAWFLAHLLCGEMPLEVQFGVPVSVDFQVLESGWLLDDLLITARNANGVERHLAISVKRGRQVTQGGFPDEFVGAAWKQWLGVDISEKPFRCETDLLCIAVGKLADTVKSAWNEIISQATATRPERLAKRLSRGGNSNAIQRSLFESLRCPETLAEEGRLSDVEVAKLAAHIRLVHLDFRSPASSDMKTGLRLCRAALLDGDLNEAVDLWNDLVAVAADMRPRGGSLDLSGLRRRLTRHSFAEYPDYRGDWRTLDDLTADAMKAARTELGPGITIPRDSLIEEICRRLEETGQEVLLGDSGSGKSALAKFVATSDVYERTVWFNAEHLDGPGLNGVKESLGLDHDLTRFLRSVGGKRALLVLDGLEKFSAPALRNAAELASALEFGAGGSRWHVLMTAQPLRWEMVQVELRKSGFQVSPEAIRQIELPRPEALAPVTRTLPSLRQPMIQPELGRLLRNLKILDWVANAVSASPGEDTGWLGLSDIIETVWTWWTNGDNNQYSRELVLRKTGVEETKSLSGVVVLDQLATADAEVLTDLEDRGILGVKQGRIRFSHDLLGDWARLQTLIPVATSELRDRAANPRWHTAIRLYGVRILERASDSSAWYDLIEELDDGSDNGQLAGLLVLEAVAVTSNARHLLERTWPHLSKDEGRLLKRLLRRFRHSATFPDPRIAELTQGSDLRIHLASSIRIPIWPYWPPMLAFLHEHMHEVKILAIEPAGELCHLWLSHMPVQTQDGQSFPWRQQAAEIAIALARELQGLQAEGGIPHSEEYEAIYKAFLAAAPDLPTQVSALALELAKRRPPSPETQQRAQEACHLVEKREGSLNEGPEYHGQMTAGHIPSLPMGELQEPWPTGPAERVDETFRGVCLNTQALIPLMTKCPEVAKEVILSLCIEPPRYEFYANDPVLGMKYGTVSSTKSAMFFTGPFLRFLEINPSKGIELIMGLVDFATERWQDWVRAKDGISADLTEGEDLSVDIWFSDSDRKLVGDIRVFGWYRERLIDAPYVVSALMALEKWLYEKAETDEDISEWVELILEQARSVAIIGVLVALAKKHPNLLLGRLRPIMSIWQVYRWDLVITQEDTLGAVGRISLMSWVRLGKDIFNTVRDWQAMSHREVPFRYWVTTILLNSKELQSYFVKIRAKWHGILESTRLPSDSLKHLIEHFDPANYSWEEGTDGQSMAVFHLPEHLREDSEKTQQASTYSLRLLDFSRKCREILSTERQLDDHEVERWWQTLEYFVNEFEEYGESIRYLNNAVMGGITVLTVSHKDWLESDEKKADWCAKQIERIVTTDNAQERFDPPESIYNVRWQVFLGEMAIHFLAEEPSDREVRSCVAQSVLAYHYDTTEHTLRAAYRIREELGEEFDRVISLGRLWAGIRRGLSWSQRAGVEAPRIREWYDDALQSFIEQDRQPTRMPFRDIAGRCESLIRETVIEQKPMVSENKNPSLLRYATDSNAPSRYRPGLDWRVIQAIYAWLPPLTEASSEQERKRWIAICEELLRIVLEYIHTAPRDKRGEISDAPSDFECWVLELIAGLIPQLREEEHPECFWQPILDLGPDAHHWVEAFLLRWYWKGSEMASSPLDFAYDWESMVEYALDSPLWCDSSAAFRLADLYIHLMGLNSFVTIFDQEDYADAVDLLWPLYEKWATRWLKHSRVAAAFARFLVKPAVKDLLLTGLIWLAQTISSIPERGWNRDRLSDDLFSLLCTCWKRHRSELETNKDIKQAFLELLNKLIAQGHSGALELRDVMIQ